MLSGIVLIVTDKLF